jgi:predicted GIY-YIG superfamily endonuclease
VYFETLASFEDALERERYLKGLLRAKNIAMIQEKNPHWLDLSANWSARLLLT